MAADILSRPQCNGGRRKIAANSGAELPENTTLVLYTKNQVLCNEIDFTITNALYESGLRTIFCQTTAREPEYHPQDL